jgi:hypothetical protein
MTRRNGMFATIYNACVDSTRITKGLLCQKHPAEGVRLFRGAPRGSEKVRNDVHFRFPKWIPAWKFERTSNTESQLDFGLPLTATRPGLVLRSRLFALFKIGPFLSLLFFQFKTLANGAEW